METALFENYYNIFKVAQNDIRSLRLPLGINEKNQLEHIDITEKPWQHLLIAGHSGTGKSMFLHTLIGSLLLNYTAKQVNLWLSDGGLWEFNRFTSFTPSHIKRINTTCDGDEYIAFTEALDTEIRQRLSYLANAKLPSFYSYSYELGNLPFPRLIVIIDCFDQFIQGLEEAGRHYITMLEAVIHRAAACGITFIVSTQEALFLARHIPSSIFALFGIRIATRQSQDSYVLLLDPVSANAARSLTLGEALVNTPSVQKIKLLFLDRATEDHILNTVF